MDLVEQEFYSVDRMARIAAKAHGNQRYGDGLHVDHLEAVDQVLLRFGQYDPVLRCTGRLHDIVEDTDVTLAQLEYEYFVPCDVINLVSAVTDEPGKNRRERHAATYPKIRQAGEGAIIVKLADRTANMEHARATGNFSMLSMYIHEYATFRRYLYDPSHVSARAMWAHLDKLCDWPAENGVH